MKHKYLVGSIGALALALSGLAVAEGTGAGDKPQQEQKDQPKQGMQEETQPKMEHEQKAEQKKAGVQRLDSVKLTSLDEQASRQLQQKLADLGYYKAEVDGKIGPKTRGALAQYFRDQAQLIVQGRLSEAGMTSLGFEESEIQRVRGMEEEGQTPERAPTRGTEEPEEGEKSKEHEKSKEGEKREEGQQGY